MKSWPLSRITASFVIVLAVASVSSTPALCEEPNKELLIRGSVEAESLWRKGFTLGDHSIDLELQSLLDTLVANTEVDPAINLSVWAVRRPELNAFALPDGSIFVYVGLLARINSWDEIAFVLGHEAHHAIALHLQNDLENFERRQTSHTLISTLMAAGLGGLGGPGVAGMAVGTASQIGLSLIAAYAITGYGRGLESEADLAGLEMIRNVGFDPCGGVASLRAMLAEREDPNRIVNVFWGSHPLLRDRIESIETNLNLECLTDSVKVADDYAHIKWPLLKLRTRLWNAMGAPHRALESAEEYATVFPRDAEIHYLIAESYREIAGVDTLELARASYRRSLELAPSGYREPLLGLSLAAETACDTTAAITYLERYLAGDLPVPRRRAMRHRLKTLKIASRYFTSDQSDTTRWLRPADIDSPKSDTKKEN